MTRSSAAVGSVAAACAFTKLRFRWTMTSHTWLSATRALRSSEKSTSTRPASCVNLEILFSLSRASFRSRGETARLRCARRGDRHHPSRAVAAQRVGGGRERGACGRDVVDEQHGTRQSGAADGKARTGTAGGRRLTGLGRPRETPKRGTGAKAERAGDAAREQLGVVEPKIG